MTTSCFTLTNPGIKCRDGIITLGESGRGRKIVTVPIPKESEISQRLETTEYEVSHKGWCASDNSEVWEWRREKPESPDWKVRNTRTSWSGMVTALESQSGGILVRIPDQSGFRGSWSAELLGGTVKVAEGFCAQGDAGRMGGGADMIVRIPEGGSVRIKRSGRRVTPESILRNVGGVPILENPAAIAATNAATEALVS